jgi:peroxiredoxin Q/BCP
MQKLVVGARAPGFSLPTESGEAVTLAQALGNGPVVLIFKPMDHKPGCTAPLSNVRNHSAPNAEAGITVYGVNNGGAASHQRFIVKHGLTAPLLVDKGLRVSAEYDAVVSVGLIRFINRTVVGVARDGTIAFYKRGTPSTDEIIGALTPAAA